MGAMKQHSPSPSPQPYLIRPRIYLGPDLIVGPGKIELLKAVRATGSISAAARTLGMSYKRAWYLLDTLKRGFINLSLKPRLGAWRWRCAIDSTRRNTHSFLYCDHGGLRGGGRY